MSRPVPIRLDADTWAVMRDVKDHPAAIITRVTDTGGESRFLVMKRTRDPAQRLMTGIYTSLEQADLSVFYGPAGSLAAERGVPKGRINGGGPFHPMPSRPKL